MVCAPQNPRHKNIYSVAHQARAPQKVDNSVAHLQNAPQKYFCGARKAVRHRTECATKLFSMRHRNIFDYLMYLTIIRYITVFIQKIIETVIYFDTVLKQTHYTISSHHLEPKIHTYSGKCQINCTKVHLMSHKS